MSYLLESLGRGLLGRLADAFERHLPVDEGADMESLLRQQELASTSVDLAIRAGAAYLHEMRLGDARRAFERALALPGAVHRAQLGLACAYHELGDVEQALRFLNRAHAADKSDPAIAFGLGFVHERNGDDAAARRWYATATDLCPRLRNGLERLGALAIRDQRWTDATEHYQQLADLEVDDLDVQLSLAALLLHADRPAEAIEVFQRALLIEPETSTEALEKVEALHADGQLSSAVKTLEKLVAKYPGVSEFHVHLADLYVKAGKDDLAVSEYRTALELHPTFLEATVKLGTQHLRAGRFADAALSFNQAVELNDRLLTAFVGLGVSQHAAGRVREGEATFDLAAGLAPNSTLLFCETARLQLKCESRRRRFEPGTGEFADEPEGDGLLGESIRRHEQAILKAPVRADLHYRQALLLGQLGEFDRALDSLRRATTICPGYCKALIKLGVGLRGGEGPEEALPVFQRALRLEPRDAEVHYQLGLLYSARSYFDIAMDQFEGRAKSPEDVRSFQHNLMLSLQNIGMVDRAAATWESLCELMPGTILSEDRFSSHAPKAE